MKNQEKISALSQLGKLLLEIGKTRSFHTLSPSRFPIDRISEMIAKAEKSNAWFTSDSIYNMLMAIGKSLDKNDIEQWLSNYEFEDQEKKTIAVIMAGNVPAVGFHDFLCVIASGHDLLAKLSTDDLYLVPAITEILISLEPAFNDQIRFTESTIKDFDAVIATGSNNTARYFEHYFGKYPHIIRKNRNGVAVLTGQEDQSQLWELGKDIFEYYGLGCRNVSKIFVPSDYDFEMLFRALEAYKHYGEHHKYNNNYDYNKSIYLVNGDQHFDNGFLLMKESSALSSPVSVLNYEYYEDISRLNDTILQEADNIQCVVSISTEIKEAIPPGTTQQPKLWDYADGVDTMGFLTKGF